VQNVADADDEKWIPDFVNQKLKEHAESVLPLLHEFYGNIKESQVATGHPEIYPDDISDLLLLIQMYERIKNRNDR
jgi:hypothetical protein